MSDDFERTPGGAILMDGARLRDETVARIRSRDRGDWAIRRCAWPRCSSVATGRARSTCG